MAAIVDELRRIPMSQRLAATLTRASDYAEAQSHAEVALEHLLLALTEDPDAGQVLAASHIDMALLKADVSQYLGGLSLRGDASGSGALSISADLRRILEAAAAAASQGRRRDINGAIVLAAIVGDGKSSAAHMLRAQGLTFEEAIKALQRAMAAAPAPTPQAQPADGPSGAVSPPPSPAPLRAAPVPASRPTPDLPPFAPRTSRTAAVERAAPKPDEGWIGGTDVETPEATTAPQLPSLTQTAPIQTSPISVPPAPVSPDAAPVRRSETPTLEDFRQAVTAELEAAKRAAYDDPLIGGRATEPADSVQAARPAGPVTSPVASTTFDPFSGQPYTPGSLPRASDALSQSSPPALPPLAPSPRLTLEPLPPRRPAEPRTRPQMPQPGGRWPDPVGPAWERPPFEQQPVGAAPTPPTLPTGASLPPPPLPAFDDFGAISPASGMPASTSRGPDQPGAYEGAYGGGTDARLRDRSYDDAAPYAQAAPWPDATMAPPPSLGPGPSQGASLGASTGTVSPQLPPLPSFGSLERPPESAPPATTYEPDVPSFDLPTLPPREPTQGRAAGRLPGADVASGRRRRLPIDNAVAGQLVENIPRRMRAHVQSTVEVRLGMGEARAMLEGLDGEAMVHSVIAAPAMSVRLRGPKGAFLIEPLSPETQWLDGRVGPIEVSHAAWRWNVTPLTAGRRRLQLVISARTGRADGTFADTAVPDQVVEVSVATNYGRATAKVVTWTTLAVAGGLVGRFGEQAYQPIVETITRLIR